MIPSFVFILINVGAKRTRAVFDDLLLSFKVSFFFRSQTFLSDSLFLASIMLDTRNSQSTVICGKWCTSQIGNNLLNHCADWWLVLTEQRFWSGGVGVEKARSFVPNVCCKNSRAWERTRDGETIDFLGIHWHCCSNDCSSDSASVFRNTGETIAYLGTRSQWLLVYENNDDYLHPHFLFLQFLSIAHGD